MKRPLTFLLILATLTACNNLHPLEEKQKFQRPQVVKADELIIEADVPAEMLAPKVEEISDPSRYYIY